MGYQKAHSQWGHAIGLIHASCSGQASHESQTGVLKSSPGIHSTWKLHFAELAVEVYCHVSCRSQVYLKLVINTVKYKNPSHVMEVLGISGPNSYTA